MTNTLSLNPCKNCGTKENVSYVFGLEAWSCPACKAHEAHSKYNENCDSCYRESRLINAKRTVDKESLGTNIRQWVVDDINNNPNPLED